MNKNTKLAVRILAWVLAALMFLGSAVIVLQVVASANAETVPEVQVTDDAGLGGEEISTEPEQAQPEQAQPEQAQPEQETPEQSQPEQVQLEQETPEQVQPEQAPLIDYSEYFPHLDVCQTPVRVGVFYIYGDNNCLAFSHNIFSENGLMFYSMQGEEYSFFHTTNVPATIMRDFSASKNSSGKYYHTTDSNTHIIYHCVTTQPVEKHTLDTTIENFKSLLPENTVVFPLYMSGQPHIAVGTYPDKAASESDCENMKTLLGVDFSPRTPNNTSISVVETNTGKILFKVDTKDCKLFVRPLQSEDGEKEKYIKSSVGNIFDGTFEYKTTIDGLYLVNILELDDYIKSVLPYEISASWPEETLKAFSIIVRSYTLSNLTYNHKKQDFDMCDETHCQAYRGRLRSTDITDAAVDETANTVLAYDGQICKTFYHAISGGMTEASENVWYTRYEYLRPVSVPDEAWWNYTYGEWSNTITKDEFFSYLENNSKVSAKITAPIKSVRISEYTPSGYAYKLEIIDENGTVAEFEKTDTVRTILSKYCKSARISIGQTTDVLINGESATLDALNFYQTSPTGEAIRFNAKENTTVPEYKTVLTASGEVQLIPTSEMITLSGTGWGHGVGMSQYGARDMARAGYNWIEIATYFFPGAYLAKVDDLSTPLFTETETDTSVTDEPDAAVQDITTENDVKNENSSEQDQTVQSKQNENV